MRHWNAQIHVHENIISAARVNAVDGTHQVNIDDAGLPWDMITDAPQDQTPRSWEGDTSGGVRPTTVNINDIKDVETFFHCVSRKFKLNAEQEIAFMIMSKTFALHKTFVNVDMNTLEEPFPLHMFLTGPGRTGSAAALNDGMTIHKAFGISICDKASRHSMQTMDGKEWFVSSLSDISRRRLETNFKDMDVLVIDEVSLLQQEWLLDVKAGCHYGKDLTQWWFSGMMVIFTGDLYQFPPVKGSAVYSRIKEHTAIDHKNLSKHIGRQCMPEDVSLFNERVIKTFSYQCGVDMDGVEAVVVVHTNLLRHSINSYKAMSNCSTQDVITCCATDRIGGRLVPEMYRADLLDRDVSHVINKGGLHGCLAYYVGMPVILRSRNISTDLKITNGAQGFLHFIQTDIDEYGYVCAKYAIVEFPGSDVHLDGLPPGCFPIKPITWTFRHEIQNAEGKCANMSVTREQMPFQAGFACTGQVAQGQTMPSILAYMNEGSFAAYVAASHATCREGLFVAHPVQLEQLNQALPVDLVKEMRKFNAMAWTTLIRYRFREGSKVPVEDSVSLLYLLVPNPPPANKPLSVNAALKRPREEGKLDTGSKRRFEAVRLYME
ncbi:hypothetical protein EV421DRAFT_1742971 [Armillaria borealis]|uniref:ATP-dependent DNA helicase n=1 Tax=Armillaria borealis TaxID=47425 RepID=A0AA39IW73_9AGAR|nr:hypothetical protein EV421DRAFT_1742971 [Armillaria borealis]